MNRHRIAVPLLALLSLLAFTFSDPATAADRTLEELLAQGEGALDRRAPQSAVRSFERAEKQADGGSVHARLGLARAHLALDNPKKAMRFAERALELARELEREPEALVAAYTYLGVARSERALGARRPEEDLAAAEEAFRAALAVPEVEKPPTLDLNLGLVLLRQKRDEEGVALLERFLETEPSEASAAQARSLIDDPRRARERRVPQLSLVTLDGQELTEDDLEGTVVVFDFWTTWCVPCRHSVPTLREIHEMTEEGAPVRVVSVSGDRSEQLVRDYVRSQSIPWTQIWDAAERTAHTLFGVGSYPTFVVIGHDGQIVHRDAGWSDTQGAVLLRETRSAVKKAERSDG